MIKNNSKFKVIVIYLVLLFSFVNAKASTEAGASEPCNKCAEATFPTEILPAILETDAKARLEGLEAPYTCAPNQTNADPDCLLINWLHWKHQDYSPKCREFFLDNSGKLGAYSKQLASLMLNDIIRNKDKSVFSQNVPDFEIVCPGFNGFTLIQKMAFHGWIFELTAFPESSCNVDVKPAVGVNDTAVCMYQLELNKENRYWRSKGTEPKYCAVSNEEIQTMKGCTGCAFDEYMRKLKKDGTPFGDVKDGKKIRGSYWASHNRLPAEQKACMEKHPGKNNKGRPNWLDKCKDEGFSPNWEWQARVNFFKRLPRFPLCKTPEAEEQKKLLADFERSRAAKKK